MSGTKEGNKKSGRLDGYVIVTPRISEGNTEDKSEALSNKFNTPKMSGDPTDLLATPSTSSLATNIASATHNAATRGENETLNEKPICIHLTIILTLLLRNQSLKTLTILIVMMRSTQTNR